jgi:hypothetical protein
VNNIVTCLTASHSDAQTKDVSVSQCDAAIDESFQVLKENRNSIIGLSKLIIGLGPYSQHYIFSVTN